MRQKFSTLALMRVMMPCIAGALIAGCSGGGMTPQTGSNPAALQSLAQTLSVRDQIANGTLVEACHDLTFGQARCLALGLRDTSLALVHRAGTPDGYGPSQLQAAYNITSAAQSNPGGLVAVVEAGGYPNLEADLAVYRKKFGLPNCDVKSGCLKIVNQRGKSSPLPGVIKGWLAEQALDVDMVSANCPKCKILVVQAASNLYTAELSAAGFNPVAISNSWGGPEYRGEKRDSHRIFSHPGIAVTASSGDDGYGVIFPSAADTVTAVGGTSLQTSGVPRGYTETVWDGSGSGCSARIPVPTWQSALEIKLGGCANRLVSDVAYVADPYTGVAVYQSMRGDGERPGWQVWGGTSVGSPAIAAIYALSGDTAGIPASIAYANPSDLYDITSGSNGTCVPSYLCTGEKGYDGPTGLGTPNGLGAF